MHHREYHRYPLQHRGVVKGTPPGIGGLGGPPRATLWRRVRQVPPGPPLPLSPWLPTPLNRRFQRAQRTLDEIVYRLIEERRRAGEDTGEGMSDRQLHAEVLTIILAGHETTAVALSWAWYLLARHPEVERKLADELAGALGGRAPSFGDLPNLPYTKMAIEETMRLYPPS